MATAVSSPIEISPAEMSTMSVHYRKVRTAVFEDATKSSTSTAQEHYANKRKLRDHVTRLCNEAQLDRYRGSTSEVASKIWRVIWTRIRNSGRAPSDTAVKQVAAISPTFDDFRSFCTPSWNVDVNKTSAWARAPRHADSLIARGSLKLAQAIRMMPASSTGRSHLLAPFASFLTRSPRKRPSSSSSPMVMPRPTYGTFISIS